MIYVYIHIYITIFLDDSDNNNAVRDFWSPSDFAGARFGKFGLNIMPTTITNNNNDTTTTTNNNNNMDHTTTNLCVYIHIYIYT